MPNDALVYLAVTLATFAAVPSFFWLKDKRHKTRERRRTRAIVEGLKAKMEASRAGKVARALDVAPLPPASNASTVDDHEDRNLDEAKEKKKRSKDRRKRGRESSRMVRSKKPLTSARSSSATDYTPRAPDQSHFSPAPVIDSALEKSPFSPGTMLDMASPTPLSLIPSFHPSSPSPSRSETSSPPGPSRSASASPTTAPLTPPSLPTSHTLPSIVKTNHADTWALHRPRDDPAWDWDGQSSTYSAGSRAASFSSRAKAVPRDMLESPSSPASPSMPSTPSLVFPSLNTYPPPGASLVTQIASLKGALEASRTREDMHRRDAERWSKECDLIKWRWNEAGDIWRRREAEVRACLILVIRTLTLPQLQAQMHHLMHQVQTLALAMQAASLSPPLAAFTTGQSPFPLAIPFPTFNHTGSPFGGIHPFDHRPSSTTSDKVNEGLAEAILKRPDCIRLATTTNLGSVTCRDGSQEEHHGTSMTCDEVDSKLKSASEDNQEVVEFEFPTLLERHLSSSSVDPTRKTAVNVDGVEIFN